MKTYIVVHKIKNSTHYYMLLKIFFKKSGLENYVFDDLKYKTKLIFYNYIVFLYKRIAEILIITFYKLIYYIINYNIYDSNLIIFQFL